MPLKRSAAVPQVPSKPPAPPYHVHVPQDRTLLLAWSALVILYGSPG